MHNYCYELDFNIPFLRRNINPYDYNRIDYMNTLNIYQYINLDILKLLIDLHLKFTAKFLFFSKPFESSPIHVDTPGVYDFVKLNFTQGGLNSYMKWYDIRNGDNIIRKFPEGSNFYDESEVNFLHSQQLPKLALVQAGVPHNVITGPEERFTISITLTTKDDKPISIGRAIDIFSKYIIKQDRI
jgi:hypothetical protein